MRVGLDVSRITNGVFVALRSELSAFVAMAEAIAKTAPKGYLLSDKVRFVDGAFLVEWENARRGDAVDDVQQGIIEGTIRKDLTQVQVRRSEANEKNQAIPELPIDAKFLTLNKTLSDAPTMKVELGAENGSNTPVWPVEPRRLLVRAPDPVPVEMQLDLVVTGSNVVGGDFQYRLFEDTMVEVVYFVRGGRISQIRARVAIRLANVQNLVTRIRVRCSQTRPEDAFVTALEVPELYFPPTAA